MGVGLGREQARNRVNKELHRRFGKPRDIWEQARIAARAHSGVLILLPGGARLLEATDATDALRTLLRG